ncbi:MAG TPA: SIS domain-containing protein [Acidimicrobiia bacterium]|nr:SIS domain-containing protein [Acidimicrobiia bacterium]
MSAMAVEIAEIPAALTGLLDGRDEIKTLASQVCGRFRRAVLLGGGSSDHAATYARYLFETELRIPASLAAPSVTTVYGAGGDWSDALVVGVSQSGRCPDLVGVLEEARNAGAVTLAITNDTRSPRATAAHTFPDCGAGEEKSVPATKSSVAELAAIACLVSELSGDATLASERDALPRAIAGFLSAADLASCGLLASVAADEGVPPWCC